jgi:hypothetical protein
MAADDATEKDAPSTNDEPEEDVEGNWGKLVLTPDPEALALKASDDGESDPAKSWRGP